MRLAFMSSVCPKMSLAELLEAGRKYGYEGIEFRPEWGHGHGVELTASTEQRKEIAAAAGRRRAGAVLHRAGGEVLP